MRSDDCVEASIPQVIASSGTRIRVCPGQMRSGRSTCWNLQLARSTCPFWAIASSTVTCQDSVVTAGPTSISRGPLPKLPVGTSHELTDDIPTSDLLTVFVSVQDHRNYYSSDAVIHHED